MDRKAPVMMGAEAIHLRQALKLNHGQMVKKDFIECPIAI
jgi:hypothetical protein